MELRATVEQLCNSPVARISPLSGGCVGDVFGVDLVDGRQLVAKVADDISAGLAREGRMLQYLAARTELPVPQIIQATDRLLLMTRLPSGGSITPAVQAHAAQLLAALHNITADQFGFDETTVIGGLDQPNPWTTSWRDFFAEHRLRFMAGEAHRVGRLPSDLLGRVESLSTRLDRWIGETARPSLVHGDLWSGNLLCADGRVTGFIDPAIHFADSEVELAFTTLFGTFNDAFFAPYAERRPIAPGFFEERRDLYNLYPLLVHVRLFGGSYIGAVERGMKKFGF